MALTNPNFVINTSFANVNVSSAASVYQWTVAADNVAYISVALTVAGNGDYVAYLTHKWLTAGSTYTILPKTTGTAAAGETTISFTSGPVIVKATDVINVMIDGLAGDISVSGFVRIAALNFSTAEATDTHTAQLTSAAYSLIAEYVWTEPTTSWTGGTSFGGVLGDVGATVWTYPTRTLTQSAVSVASTVSGSKLTIQRGDSLSAAFTGMTSNTGYTSIWFTLKRNPEDLDSAALIQIKKNASGLSDGLLYVNGAAAADATKGSITVVSSTALTVVLDETITDDLVPEAGLYYDFQMLVSGAVTTISSGVCNVDADITRSVT